MQQWENGQLDEATIQRWEHLVDLRMDTFNATPPAALLAEVAIDTDRIAGMLSLAMHAEPRRRLLRHA